MLNSTYVNLIWIIHLLHIAPSFERLLATEISNSINNLSQREESKHEGKDKRNHNHTHERKHRKTPRDLRKGQPQAFKFNRRLHGQRNLHGVERQTKRREDEQKGTVKLRKLCAVLPVNLLIREAAEEYLRPEIQPAQP